MRKFIKDFVGVCFTHLPVQEPIYEFGAYQTEGQEGFADLRVFFRGKKYIGADMRLGPGVDVVLDLHRLDLESESVGTAILMDTLEHVEFPHLAMEEVYRVLKPGGVVVISSVMNFPIHDYPYDYWRFTPTAFQSVLRNFITQKVEFVGQKNFPHTVVGIGVKGEYKISDELASDLQKWKQASDRKSVKQVIRLFIPPVLIDIYDALRQKK